MSVKMDGAWVSGDVTIDTHADLSYSGLSAPMMSINAATADISNVISPTPASFSVLNLNGLKLKHVLLPANSSMIVVGSGRVYADDVNVESFSIQGNNGAFMDGLVLGQSLLFTGYGKVIVGMKRPVQFRNYSDNINVTISSILGTVVLGLDSQYQGTYSADSETNESEIKSNQKDLPIITGGKI
ncbi:hypothetical protein HK096_005862, partial [Nowakowskiella sp. JEL0078]